MQYLRKATAATIMFGPFVDKTDGVTLKTDATTITDIDHASTGIFLSKAGAAAAIRHAAVTASVADAYGMMKVTLDTTDTGTTGSLDVLFAKAATYLPVSKECVVLEQVVYDVLFGTVALATVSNITSAAGIALAADQAVNATKIGGTAQTGRDLGASVLLAANQHVIVDSGTVTTTTNLTNLPAAAALEATVQSILTDTAEIGAAGAGLTVLASAANLATVAGYLDTEIAAVLADTNELQTDWANGGRLDLILDARSSQTSVDDLPTNAELATALGTADDAVLAAIPSAATVATAVWAKVLP